MDISSVCARRIVHDVRRVVRATALTLAAGGLIASPSVNHAADGCLVLLCFAAPSWSSIQQCVPPIQQVLDDLAHGRPFPSCPMSGPANTARNQWSDPPAFCPPQYTHMQFTFNGQAYSCDYDAAVEVDIDGAFWARTWWRMSGGTVTEFSAAAKAQLGTWDTQFDDDYASWLAQQPPPPPPCPTC